MGREAACFDSGRVHPASVVYLCQTPPLTLCPFTRVLNCARWGRDVCECLVHSVATRKRNQRSHQHDLV